MLFAWANAYAAPCLMSKGDAGAAPVAQSGHDGHAMARDAAHHDSVVDCEHCPPGAGHDADRCKNGISADCDTIVDVGTEFRKAEFKTKSFTAPFAPYTFRRETRRDLALSGAPPPDIGLRRWRIDPLLYIENSVYLK